MWKKVLFIGIALVIGIGVYFLGYNSNQANHIYDMVNEAIESEKYSDVARILGGCFDTKTIYTDDSDDYDIVIYPATSLTSRVNYGENQVYYHYEKAYYFYMFKTRFSVDKTNSGMQKTGFRFYSENGTYDYHFVVNSETNSDEYKNSPANLEEVLLNQEHQNLTNTDLKFVNCTLTKSQIEQISNKIGGSITKMGIINSSGDEIDQFDIQLNFNEAFFIDKDIDSFVTTFDQYLQNAIAAEGDKNKLKELQNEFNEYSNNWEHNVFPALAEEHGYTLRFENEILSPASLIWKTIGMLALYAAVVVVFYILIFHFSKIKRIFSRETYKDYGKRRGGGTYVNGKREEDKKEKKPVEKEQAIDAVVEEKEKEEEKERMKKVRKAVIPAAGFGTRFLPFTKAVPKEMLPIVDIPTIEYIVREALESGIEEVLIIINHEKECIRTHFGHNTVLEDFLKSKNKEKELGIIQELPNRIKVSFVYQEEQLGLGHAVLCAEEFANNEPFALLLGDDVYVGKDKPATLQLIEAYEQTASSILGTLEVPLEDVCKYGICKPISQAQGSLLKLESVVEKPSIEVAPSRLAIGGRYILTPAIFSFLHTQTRGAGGEIQLTDSILRLMSVESVYSLAISGNRYDIGSKKGFLEATVDFALNREDLSADMKEIIKTHKA